ncbi:type VI secretion system protein TssA [Cupriavidus basilensis]
MRWDPWLQPIRPGDAPAGDDPGYDDDFLAIKHEVAKLSGVDDTLIVESAERLLKLTAKDLRLAVYYVYGRMRRDGAEGVAAGFELLSALVDRFGARLLPARAEGPQGGTRMAGRRDVHGPARPGARPGRRAAGTYPVGTGADPRTYGAVAGTGSPGAGWAHPSLRGPGRVTVGHRQPWWGRAIRACGRLGPCQPWARWRSARDLLDRARQMALYLRQQHPGLSCGLPPDAAACVGIR